MPENAHRPLSHASPKGDRSMFSADVFHAKHVFRPKNGPVPSRPLRGGKRRTATLSHPRGCTISNVCQKYRAFRGRPASLKRTGRPVSVSRRGAHRCGRFAAWPRFPSGRTNRPRCSTATRWPDNACSRPGLPRSGRTTCKRRTSVVVFVPEGSQETVCPSGWASTATTTYQVAPALAMHSSSIVAVASRPNKHDGEGLPGGVSVCRVRC